MTCPYCSKSEGKTFKSKATGLEWTYPQKASSYKDAEKLCQKGWRLPMLWEIIKLLQSEDKHFILDYEKGEWRYFWSLKENNSVHRVFRFRGGSWNAYWDDSLDDCNEDCRVVFVRELKK